MFLAVGQLGEYLLEVGNLDESEQYLRECLDIHRHSIQEQHPHTAFRMSKRSIMSNQHVCVSMCLDLYSIEMFGKMSAEEREQQRSRETSL